MGFEEEVRAAAFDALDNELNEARLVIERFEGGKVEQVQVAANASLQIFLITNNLLGSAQDKEDRLNGYRGHIGDARTKYGELDQALQEGRRRLDVLEQLKAKTRTGNQ
ncbi:MAG: hypothetical protein V3S37_04500 [Dehalococcoidia bacterium]